MAKEPEKIPNLAPEIIKTIKEMEKTMKEVEASHKLLEAAGFITPELESQYQYAKRVYEALKKRV